MRHRTTLPGASAACPKLLAVAPVFARPLTPDMRGGHRIDPLASVYVHPTRVLHAEAIRDPIAILAERQPGPPPDHCAAEL